jgi:hypothetical protein
MQNTTNTPLYLDKINTQFLQKQKFLLNKKKELSKKINTNPYLIDVSKAYDNYYHKLLQDKQTQYDSLLLLQKYLNELKDTTTDKNKLSHIKHDETSISNELNFIKKYIHKLSKYK